MGHPAYGVLLAESATTGCCPVWISDGGLRSLEVPADLQNAVAEIDGRDPAGVLAERWPWIDPGGRSPFGAEFPGLVAPAGSVEDMVGRAEEFATEVGWSHLALVPVSRPADIVAALGWLGTVNYHRDVTGMSAVLRSWEERFGAVLVRLDRATLWLSVAGPPRSERDCLGVAAEHFAFCCDVDGEDPRPLPDYAASLAGRSLWRFWWD